MSKKMSSLFIVNLISVVLPRLVDANVHTVGWTVSGSQDSGDSDLWRQRDQGKLLLTKKV